MNVKYPSCLKMSTAEERKTTEWIRSETGLGKSKTIRVHITKANFLVLSSDKVGYVKISGETTRRITAKSVVIYMVLNGNMNRVVSNKVRTIRVHA